MMVVIYFTSINFKAGM